MTKSPIPTPLTIPWLRKPLDSATTKVEILPDGRIKLWIKHAIIHGVTPKMLVWWFKHIEGDIEIAGQHVSRYRAWHPIDHIHYNVHKRSRDGSVGAGSVYHIHEAFSGNPKWELDILTYVDKLDETGFIHGPRKLGIKVAHMEYEFEATTVGTQYTNWLIAGLPLGLLGRPFNRLIRGRFLPDDKAIAWLTHNVEEVGNFESFLPDLYRRETGDPG